MNKFIGLEVNSQAITLAYLAVTGKRLILLKGGSVKFEKKEANTQKTVSALKDLLKDVDLMDAKVISTINHQHLFVRELIFPQMSNKELLEAIRWKVKDYLTFPIEEAVIDVKITEKISEVQFKRLKVLVVAIQQDALLEHINILKGVGIMPSVITIAPLAFESLLAHMKVVKDEVVATLNIGTAITVISIYKNQKLEFTRMITSKLDRLSMEVRLSLDYFLY